MKTCSSCGEDRPEESFYRRRNGDLRRDCKRCYGEARKSNVRQRDAAIYGSQKNRARRLLKDAVRRGAITKPPRCESCKTELPKTAIQGHHDDYSQPFSVRWLCAICHVQAHRELAQRAAATTESTA